MVFAARDYMAFKEQISSQITGRGLAPGFFA